MKVFMGRGSKMLARTEGRSTQIAGPTLTGSDSADNGNGTETPPFLTSPGWCTTGLETYQEPLSKAKPRKVGL